MVIGSEFMIFKGQLSGCMKISKVNAIRKLEKNLPMKKELLSIPEAAELLSCSTRTVRRLIAERTLEACKLRSSTRVVYASLRGYILTIIGDYQEKNGVAEFKSSG
jgi:excisionase family DNA binding protein